MLHPTATYTALHLRHILLSLNRIPEQATVTHWFCKINDRQNGGMAEKHVSTERILSEEILHRSSES
jgi:hypothetical protein